MIIIETTSNHGDMLFCLHEVSLARALNKILFIKFLCILYEQGLFMSCVKTRTHAHTHTKQTLENRGEGLEM